MNLACRLFLSLLFVASGAACAAATADAVNAVNATVRLMPPGAKATAAFMVLKNSGDRDAKLVKAESAVAKTVELHTHLNEDGVMKMRQVPAIEIKAKSETSLQPGGFHIMLIDPVALKDGEKVSITLVFADGSSRKIEAVVARPTAAPMPMSQGGHEHMH